MLEESQQDNEEAICLDSKHDIRTDSPPTKSQIDLLDSHDDERSTPLLMQSDKLSRVESPQVSIKKGSSPQNPSAIYPCSFNKALKFADSDNSLHPSEISMMSPTSSPALDPLTRMFPH
jgi:hypothetical protein